MTQELNAPRGRTTEGPQSAALTCQAAGRLRDPYLCNWDAAVAATLADWLEAEGPEGSPEALAAARALLGSFGIEPQPGAAAAVAGGKWRVQFISRRDIGEPDRDEGRRDFDTKAEAETYFGSDEVQSRLGVYWRAELRYLPPARVVVSQPFLQG